MNIYIQNKSTVLHDDDVKALHAPLIVYSRHIRSWWGTMQPGIFFGEPLVPNAWQIIIVDDSDQAGALGYHDVTPDGRPISYVFAKTDMDYGYDWHVTLTHEFAEMLLDPYIMRCEQTGDAKFHALELCDPVEADDFYYPIDAGGTRLRASDFITPLWFVPDAQAGAEYPLRFDHLGHCEEPLQVLDGGYAYYWENGQWYSEDHLGRKMTVAEFQAAHPTKTRLAMYARKADQSESLRRFHIFRSTVTNEFYFRLIAENGRTIGASEGYRNHKDIIDLHDTYFSDWRIEDESGGEA